MECFCGSERQLTTQHLMVRYKDKLIRILDVPVYVCRNDHVKLGREVTVRIKFDLEQAHKVGITEWHFGS